MPGLPLKNGEGQELVDLLSATLLGRPDVYVVFREDLPLEEPATQALADGFGAEPGDTIIEFKPGAKPGQLRSQEWRLPEAA